MLSMQGGIESGIAYYLYKVSNNLVNDFDPESNTRETILANITSTIQHIKSYPSFSKDVYHWYLDVFAKDKSVMQSLNQKHVYPCRDADSYTIIGDCGYGYWILTERILVPEGHVDKWEPTGEAELFLLLKTTHLI
jgi:hypothetical protein